MKKIIILVFLFLFCNETKSQQWLLSAGSNSHDEALAIATSNTGFVYTTGFFSGSATFGNIQVNSSGLDDVFISKTNEITGTHLWVKKFGGAGLDRGRAIATDATGDIIIAGTFDNTANFLGTLLTAVGSNDIFIAKINAAGNLIWVTQCGGIQSADVNNIAIDANDNIIVTGAFYGQASFGSITLTSTINPANGLASADIFIAKLDAAGNFLWARNGTANENDNGVDVVCDNQNNIYALTLFSDTIQFDVLHPNTAKNAIGVFKFDANGNELDFLKIASTTSNEPIAITINSIGQIGIVGNFQSTLIIFTTPLNSITSNYTNGTFLLCLDTNFSYNWVTGQSSDNTLHAKDIVNLNNDFFIAGDFNCYINSLGNIYGTGVFRAIGYSDLWCCKYDSIGTLNYANTAGGSQNDFLYGLTNNAKISVAGSFNDNFFAALNNPFCSTNQIPVFCNDSNYDKICQLNSANQQIVNTDILIAQPFELGRQPLDKFLRYGTVCNRDFVQPCILYQGACTDSITLCPGGSGYLIFYPQLIDIIDNIPNLYTYNWTTSSQNSGTQFSSNMVSVSLGANTVDGCDLYLGTVYINEYSINPNNVLITDSKGVNILTHYPGTIQLCPGNSVVLTASNIPPNTPFYWSGYPLNDSVITVFQTGSYAFVVKDSNDCSQSIYVNVIYDDTLNYAGYYLVANAIDDTVSICGNAIVIDPYDSLNFVCLNAFVTYTISPVVPNFSLPGNCGSGITFFPDSDGYYTITSFAYFYNKCDTDTLGYQSIQVYFHKLTIPIAPTIALSGNTELCPTGDTITITASGATNYLWTGPTFIQYAYDSIGAFTPGSYYASTTVYSSDSCPATSYAYFNISLKQNPSIYSLSPYPIICPGDSIQLQCNAPGMYQWYGPQGLLIVTTQIIWVTQAGNYYCIVTDVTGCQLVSNTLIIENFVSASLLAIPSNVLCPGTTTTLSIIGSPASIVQWLPPFSGSNFSQVVDSPGTYTCLVTFCNIIDTLTITIFETQQLPLTLSSDSICFGDFVTITVDSTFVTYTWFPIQYNTPSIYTYDTGSYYVTVLDSNGCYHNSDTVHVYEAVVPAMPTLASDSICVGDTLFLTANFNATNIVWLGPNNFTSTLANPFIANATVIDTGTYYAFVYTGNCLSDTSSISITIHAKPAKPALSSNSPLCLGDNINLFASTIPNATYQWGGPQSYISTLQNSTILNSTFSDSGNYFCFISDGFCNSDTAYLYIEINARPIILSNTPHDTLCVNDTINLYASTNDTSISYSWHGPNGFISTIQNPVISSIQIVNAGTYYCVGYNGQCYSDTVAINIYINNAPPALVATSNSPLCQFDTIMLSCNATANVFWSGVNNFSSSNSNSFIANAGVQNSGWYAINSTVATCKSQSDSVYVSVIPLPSTPTIIASSPVCNGDPILFNCMDTNNFIFQWAGPQSFASNINAPVIINSTYNNTGYYFLQLINGNCKSLLDSFYVQVDTVPIISGITSNSPLCASQQIVLNSIANPFDSCWWYFNNSAINNLPAFNIDDAQLSNNGYYYITYYNKNCFAVDSILVEVEPCELEIPNIFTPNGDGTNDDWLIENSGLRNATIQIYDRWGLLIYTKVGDKITWNGLDKNNKLVPAGVYYYVLKYELGVAKKNVATGFVHVLY